jgi:hypothetical protein
MMSTLSCSKEMCSYQEYLEVCQYLSTVKDFYIRSRFPTVSEIMYLFGLEKVYVRCCHFTFTAKKMLWQHEVLMSSVRKYTKDYISLLNRYKMNSYTVGIVVYIRVSIRVGKVDTFPYGCRTMPGLPVIFVVVDRFIIWSRSDFHINIFTT